MNLSFSERDLSGGNFIPEGEHEVVIATIQQAKGKTSGADQFVVTLKDKFGREATEYLPIAENMRWKLGKFALAAGYSKEDLVKNGLTVPTLVGRTLLMVKKQSGVEMYEGKERKKYSVEYFAAQGIVAPQAKDEIPF